MTARPAPSDPCVSPEAFCRISRLLMQAETFDEVVDPILTEAMSALGADRAFIAMVDYEHGELAVPYAAGSGWNETNRRLRLEVSKETGRGITSRVAATAEPYRTGDVDNDPYYMSFFPDVKSELAVPIIDADGRTQGVINFESGEPDSFTQQHEYLLTGLADLIALRLQADLRQRRQAVLVNLSREFGRFARQPDLYARVIDLVAEAIRFEDCSLFLVNKEETHLVLQASRGSLGERVNEARYDMGEGLTGWVAANAEIVRTNDPRSDPRWRGLHEELPPEEVGGLIAAPIMGYDRVIGVIRMLRRRSSHAWVENDFTEDDEELVVAIASILGAIIESIHLVSRLMSAERMAAWGEMSARSAHMIGNRVFAIKGDLNELRHVSETGCTQVALNPIIASIEKGVMRLEEILAEFREFVMATKLVTEPLCINGLVKEATEEAFPRKSPVRLELSLQEGLPMVEADATKLRRCFSELVENSFNFQQDSGLVRVCTQSIGGEPPQVRIVFEDTGPGIALADKKNIFRPFYTTRAKGMGLGLPIAKGIVEAHGGTIKEVGEEGQGARFEIVLPGLSESAGCNSGQEQR